MMSGAYREGDPISRYFGTPPLRSAEIFFRPESRQAKNLRIQVPVRFELGQKRHAGMMMI
jgi:hypothetical protein